MRVRGLGRLKAQWSRIRGQLRPGPTVLLYHRIAQLAEDPHLMAVSPAHFEEQLVALRQHYQVVSLGELAQGLTRGRSVGPVVALTFDDGYADNATTGLPLLRKHGVPATFYLPSGFVGTTREYLQDDLERLLLLSQQCPDELQLAVGGKRFAWAMRSQDGQKGIGVRAPGWNITLKTDPTPRHRAHREIHDLLRCTAPRERETVLHQLRSQCDDPGSARPTHCAMSWDRAREMAACELVELGAHTVNHPWLSALPLAEQRREILGSKRDLEEQIGRTVASFAYPYGPREAYTMETVGVVKEAGFTNACSVFRERIGRHTDPFQLPRFVVRDWNGDEFLQRLKGGRL